MLKHPFLVKFALLIASYLFPDNSVGRTTIRQISQELGSIPGPITLDVAILAAQKALQNPASTEALARIIAEYITDDESSDLHTHNENFLIN